MLTEIETRLTAAAAALSEQEVTEARREDLLVRQKALHDQVAELRVRATTEQRDVDALGRLSLSSVLATLRGRRDEALAREQAEAVAAAFKLADAEARLAAVDREHSAAEARLLDLGDARYAYEQILDEKEELLARAGGPAGRRLLTLAADRGRLDGEITELAEAIDAAEAAAQALAAAQSLLSSASGWSTYDTFFGGGALSSTMKHDRLDAAARAVGEASELLAVLRTELDDVSGFRVQLPNLAVDGMTRFLDVWFDNIFTDLKVREQIREARMDLELCADAVGEVRGRLDARRLAAADKAAKLEQERRDLLGAA
ncbi:DNA repair exonuclease SbcCD ATPase subunit [Hamadaea flava]|uniref:Uncharacterized protein n=1 Tax=Hamadaea flava TaxID=1742688 RepID=A0ABV8LNJ0_9ACTN|nr:hypothetical protein [Hamadaea flava]MCP2322810.1 DNA repair exonuclease SbcCD ATPase subunit [Hamadaea flava]